MILTDQGLVEENGKKRKLKNSFNQLTWLLKRFRVTWTHSYGFLSFVDMIFMLAGSCFLQKTIHSASRFLGRLLLLSVFQGSTAARIWEQKLRPLSAKCQSSIRYISYRDSPAIKINWLIFNILRISMGIIDLIKYKQQYNEIQDWRNFCFPFQASLHKCSRFLKGVRSMLLRNSTTAAFQLPVALLHSAREPGRREGEEIRGADLLSHQDSLYFPAYLPKIFVTLAFTALHCSLCWRCF